MKQLKTNKTKEFKDSRSKMPLQFQGDLTPGIGVKERIDANVSIRNGWGSSEPVDTQEYFFWTMSFSVPTSTNVDASITETESSVNVVKTSSTEVQLPAGIYNINANVTWNVNTSGKREIAIEKNWSVVAWRNRPATVGWVMMGISHVMRVAEGDKISIRMYQDSGSTVSSTSFNTLWIIKL